MGIGLWAYLRCIVAVVVYILEVHFLFFNVPYGRINYYPPYPTLKSPFELELANILEHLYKRVLDHIFRFHRIIGIPKANAHHLTGIPVKQHALATGILPYTPFDKFVFFCHLVVFGSLGQYIDTVVIYFVAWYITIFGHFMVLISAVVPVWGSFTGKLHFAAGSDHQELAVNIIYHTDQAVGFPVNGQLPVCPGTLFENLRNILHNMPAAEFIHHIIHEIK